MGGENLQAKVRNMVRAIGSPALWEQFTVKGQNKGKRSMGHYYVTRVIYSEYFLFKFI
jgi:hypothetical protein